MLWPLRIAIVGAGISGLTAAIALSKKGFSSIRIYERAPAATELGAGIQLGPNAVRELENLGLTEQLASCADSCAQGQMRDGETNLVLARLPFSDFSKRAYGVASYQLLRSDLHRILLDRVVEAGVAISTNKQLLNQRQTEDGVELEFADGDSTVADLVIAAEGINSIVANQMHPEYPIRYSGYACWRALLDRDDLGNHWLDSVCVWTGEDRHLVVYPVANSSKLNLVATVAKTDWNFPSSVQSSDPEQLRNAYQGWSEQVLDIIGAVKSTQLWGLFERPPLPFWHRQGAVLIGDAAHPMLPSLAQGAAQGIEDAVQLAELLSQLESAAELDQVLGHFFSLRSDRVARVQASAHWNLAYFHQPKGVYRSIRNLAMRVPGGIASGLIARRYHWLYRAR